MQLGNLAIIDHNIRRVTIVDYKQNIIMMNVLPMDERQVLKEWRNIDVQKIQVVNGVIYVVPVPSGWMYEFVNYVEAHNKVLEYKDVISALKRCGLQRSDAIRNAKETLEVWEQRETRYLETMEDYIPGSVTGTHIGEGKPYET